MAELKDVLQDETMKIPDNEVAKIIKEVDVNKDGKIDYKEFLAMMKRDM